MSQRTTKPKMRDVRPAHPRSPIKVFADRACLLQPPAYPLPCCVDLRPHLSICWFHKS